MTQQSTDRRVKIALRDLDVKYKKARGHAPALQGVSFDILEGEVLALLGPSGCGKSSVLWCVNRMIEYKDAVVTGIVMLDGENVRNIEDTELRRRIGIVFQKPNPFAKPIFENIAYGLRIHGLVDKAEIEEKVERALRRANLWEEVRERLDEDARKLSVGQQQRLCIARAIVLDPEVLLMDEPTSALDPPNEAWIEEVVSDLAGNGCTIVIVTHSTAQAARLSNRTAFFWKNEENRGGELIALDETDRVITNPPDDPRIQMFVRLVLPKKSDT